ncbi:MAG: hypothetical protein IPN95_01540 [Bacteroidetes bacterium]|nr:hypothetical protein [Bacteroidota bacterium]
MSFKHKLKPIGQTPPAFPPKSLRLPRYETIAPATCLTADGWSRHVAPHMV